MELTVRPYKPGDEISISEMFTRNTPYLRDNAFWLWINRLLPSHPSLISVVADDNNNIWGHTAIMPYEMKVGDRVVRCGMSYHTIIDEKYRDKDIVMPLLELADQLAVEEGLEFHYGFPNKNARPIYKFPNHCKVDKFLALEMESPRETEGKDTTYSFSQIKEIDYNFLFSLNHILDLRDKENIELCRNIQYYCARYFFHPQKLYKSYKIYDGVGFVGCLVTKIYEKKGKKYFHIIDLLIEDGKLDYEMLLTDIIRYFSGACDVFSFWKINERFKDVLLNKGFQEKGFDTFLGLCFLPNNKISEEEKNLLTQFQNWRLVMGDSDAF